MEVCPGRTSPCIACFFLCEFQLFILCFPLSTDPVYALRTVLRAERSGLRVWSASVCCGREGAKIQAPVIRTEIQISEHFSSLCVVCVAVGLTTVHTYL